MTIPEELKALSQWVCWRREAEDGAMKKKPYDPTRRRWASTADSSTWTDFETAEAALRAGNIQYSGIGFVFTSDDPFVGIDIDNCVDDGGTIQAWAQDLIDLLDSYSEISPSGRGVKIFLRGTLPEGTRNKKLSLGPAGTGSVEIYASGRYFTVTGQHVAGTPETVEERDGALQEFMAQIFDRKPDPTPTGGGGELSHEDQEVVDDVRSTEKGRRLWDGDTFDYGGDDSSADLALCNMLAPRCENDPKRIDRIFRQSGLIRQKWDEKRRADGATYGQMTIGKALDGVKRAEPRSPSSLASRPWPEPLADAALHGLAGEIVRAIEPETEADPAGLLVDFLVCFGNVVGRNAHFIADGARHYPNLYAVLVGDTSKARKGTARSHIGRVFENVFSEWTDDHVKSGLSTGEGLIWDVRDPHGKGDKAVEGVDDKRLLLIETEYSSVLTVIARAGNTLSPIIRQAWDTGELRIMTKNSPAKATGAHISMIAHITTEELIRNLNSTEISNGFGNRFLFVCVRRSKCLPEGGQATAIAHLHPRLKEAVKFGQGACLLERDGAARSLWAKGYPALSEGHPGIYGSLTSRSEAQVMRLAMVYALLDCSPLIRIEHLRAALALWKYCAASVRHIFGAALGDPVADDILRALRSAAGGGMSRTEIRDLFHKHRRAEQIESALAVLEKHKLARCGMKKTGGRPVEQWFLTECDLGDI